jgi:hypothetical protein
MKKLFIWLIISLFITTANIFAQIRPAESNAENDKPQKVEIKQPDERKMLQAIEVKYKGGLYGFSESQDGTLKFDTTNERLVFYGEDGKEKFSIPYQSMIVIYPSQTKIQSGAGRVVGAIPFPGAGLGGSFIKKKKNYMVIQFDDPDVKARGTINFLIDTGELLMSAIYSVGENAEMKARGDAYIRKNDF